MPKQLPLNPNDADLISFLQNISPFDQFTEYEIGLFTKLLSKKLYESGETVFNENNKEKILFIVEKGELDLKILWQQHKTLKAKDIFGEIAIIDNATRTGSVTANSPSVLLCVTGEDLFDKGKLDTSMAFTLFRALACKVTSYLRSSIQTESEVLMKKGESTTVEFKPRIQNKEASKVEQNEIKFNLAKAIASFLNTKGGTLLIGVTDKGKPRSLDKDFPEKVESQHILEVLDAILREKIEDPAPLFKRYIDAKVEIVHKIHRIVRVDCTPPPFEVYVKHNGERTKFCRHLASSPKLPSDERHLVK